MAREAPTPHAALPWLERAARFTPGDENLRFSIATTLLATGDASGALALFTAMSKRYAVREVWAGRTASALAAGDAPAAIAAITHTLRHFAPDTAVINLATRLAPLAGKPGWCALQSGGMVSISCQGDVTICYGARPINYRRAFPLDKSWRQQTAIHVLVDGVELLGSPLDGTAISRVEGFVERTETGLRGWAWLPASPDTDPLLIVHGQGAPVPLTATDLSQTASGATPLSRPRGFTQKVALSRALRVLGPDGRALLGSPVGGPPVIPAAVAPVDSPGTVVVIPVYRDVAVTRACLAAVLATIGADDRVMVVDDAAPEPAMAVMLAGFAGDSRLAVIPANPGDPGQNLGFPRAANAGLRAAGGQDAVLLNSDTVVFPGWLRLLRSAVHSAADIGSATPLSNNASIFSFPSPDAPGKMPDAARGAAVAALAASANAGRIVEVPTGHGFCLYMRAECLHAAGLLREDCFAQGYGEENDWTERARAAGWRHIAVPSVYVAHQGGVSFGAARGHLLARNTRILAELHPDYHARVAAFVAADPLRPARTRLAAAAFQAGARPEGAVLLISHGGIGGSARVKRERAAAIRDEGKRPLLLTAVDGVATLSEAGADSPSLRFILPQDRADLMTALRAEKTARVEIHHLLGHHPSAAKIPCWLRVPYEVWVHDYGWLCPRLSFTNGAGQFCGEAEASACAGCTAAWGHGFHHKIDAADLRAGSASLMAGAARVVVPAEDVAKRLRRHIPALEPVVVALEAEPPAPPALRRAVGEVVVAVVGAISLEKGYAVLTACAEDAAARRLPLRFHIVGYTEDDTPLLQTGRVFITGRYAAGEARGLIRAAGAHFAFLPSIWPETWCFAMTEAWQAGLRIAAFNIGVPAERLQRAQAGWLLPLGLPPARINDTLLRIGVAG